MKTQSEAVVIRQALNLGANLKRDLIRKSGGLLNSRKAAAALGISTQALRERTKAETLIVVELDGALGYPAFLFESDTVLAGVAAILRSIAVGDPWMRLNFMVCKLDELGGEMPIDAIRRGRVADVASAARHFGDHGAA